MTANEATTGANNTDTGSEQTATNSSATAGATDANQQQTGGDNADKSASAGNTDNTKTAESNTGTTTQEGKTEGDKAGEDGNKAADPEYKFTFGEGREVDESTLQEFTDVVKGLGLKPEDAQKIADFGPKIVDRMAAKQIEVVQATQAAWAESARNDKEFGGDKLNKNLATAKKALDAVASPELKKLLGGFDPEKNPTGTGLGNHPEVIRLFLHVGKALSEDSIVRGGQQGGSEQKTAAEIMYPNMKQ